MEPKNSSQHLLTRILLHILVCEMDNRGLILFGPNGARGTITNYIRIYCLARDRAGNESPSLP